MDFLKQLLQPKLKGMRFSAIVEFAQKISTGHERVERESKSCIAQVLFPRQEGSFVSARSVGRHYG